MSTPDDRLDPKDVHIEMADHDNLHTNASETAKGSEKAPLKKDGKPLTKEEKDLLEDIPEAENEEDAILEKMRNRDPDEELKKNLMFEMKKIPLTKLYCFLSTNGEVALMIVGLIGSIGGGIAGPLMSILFGGMLDDFGDTGANDTDYQAAAQGQSSADALTSRKMTDMMFNLAMDTFHDSIALMVIRFCSIGAGMFVAEFLDNFCWSLASLRQIHHLKEMYFTVILKQEQGWFDATNAYEFSTKVQAQLEQIEMGMGEKLALVIKMAVMFIAGIIVGFIAAWDMALIILCVGPFVIVCIMFLVTSLKRAIILSRKTYEIAGGIAEEMLYNIKTVSSFVNFDFELKRYGRYVDRCDAYEKEIAWKLGVSIGGIIFFLNFSSVITQFYGSYKIAKDKYPHGDLIYKLDKTSGWITTKLPDSGAFTGGKCMKVVMSTMMAIMALGGVAPNLKIIQEATTASSDFFTLQEREPKIDLHGTLEPDKETIKGRIEFKNIKFIYPSDEKKRVILEGLNLVMEPGQKVALVGESGCGKSTTVNLIERLYEPVEGSVTLDGVDIREYKLEYLRSLIGYVQQEPVLFNRSIRDNLIFGRQELLESMGDVDLLIDNAIEESYAAEFINSFDDKLNYPVGIKGSKLSGGQKQRVAIARAILCYPKILILDEATSALDTRSEKEVQRALDNISKKNVTTIIIAHRLSTIKNADKIYAIKDGHVLESGTHKELLAKNGYYAGLVRSQLAEDELESKEENLDRLKKKKSSMSKLSRMLSKNLSSHMSDAAKGDEVINPQIAMNALSTKTKGVRRGELFKAVGHMKLEFVGGAFASLVTGAAIVVQGYVNASGINNLLDAKHKSIRSKATFWGCMFIVLACVNAIFIFLKLFCFVRIGSEITTTIRKLVLKHYLELHVAYYDIEENAPGGLLTRLSLDTIQLRSLVLSIIGDVVTCIAVILIGLIWGFILEWKLTLIALCFIPIQVACRAYMAKARRGGRIQDKKINVEAGAILSECAINTKTIYSFNFQKAAVKMYLDVLEAQRAVFIRDSFLKGLMGGMGIAAVYFTSATTMWASYKFIRNGDIDYKDMNTTMNVVMMLSNGVSNNIMGLSEYTKAANAFNSVFSTLDTKSLINAFREPNKSKVTAKNLIGKIEFKNVSFAYPTKPDLMVLKNVSFTIEKGQAAALCGYSGSGKSSIIQLIERFYDATEGEILIDGVNIKDYNLWELRRKIGLVSQEPILFKRSVYENIRYGNLDAGKEEVLEAAKSACIEKFFNKKEMGTKEDPVSGGEKQRLAIARCFLKNPIIMLFDEATSALDKESEIMVQESIDILQKGRTSVTVAHRLSTIENSDIIFVLEAGRIVEKGKHKDLIAKGGKYATLYKYST